MYPFPWKNTMLLFLTFLGTPKCVKLAISWRVWNMWNMTTPAPPGGQSASKSKVHWVNRSTRSKAATPIIKLKSLQDSLSANKSVSFIGNISHSYHNWTTAVETGLPFQVMLAQCSIQSGRCDKICRELEVEEHVECECQCRTKSHHCSERQVKSILGEIKRGRSKYGCGQGWWGKNVGGKQGDYSRFVLPGLLFVRGFRPSMQSSTIFEWACLWPGLKTYGLILSPRKNHPRHVYNAGIPAS